MLISRRHRQSVRHEHAWAGSMVVRTVLMSIHNVVPLMYGSSHFEFQRLAQKGACTHPHSPSADRRPIRTRLLTHSTW